MADKPKKIALVTGVGRAEGLGFEICRQLAARGFTVLLTARDGGKAERLAERLRTDGHDVHAYRLDVTSAKDIAAIAATVEKEWLQLDVLVNNAAGASPYGEKPSNADLSQAKAVMEATLFGAWRLCQAFMPLLKRSVAGRIVNVSSGAGSHGDPVFGFTSGNGMGPGYSVAKAALNGLTAALAYELRGTRVLVNAACPGFTATFPGGESMGARPVAEGAAGIIWAATLGDDGPTGELFRDERALPW